MQTERFTPHNLAEILRDLFRSEATGRLALTGDTGEEMLAFLSCGLVDLALENGRHRDFLEKLARKADVTIPSSGKSDEVPTPDALATLLGDNANRPEVRDLLRLETKRTVEAAFQLSGGTWEFEEGKNRARFEPDIPQTLHMILDGIGAITRWAKIHRILSVQNRHLRPCQTPLFPIECLPLKPEEGYLLGCMDGHATFGDLGNLLPSADPDDLTRIVYSALVLGSIEFDPPLVQPFKLSIYADNEREEREQAEKDLERIDSLYISLQTESPYTLFGVTDGASWNEIRQAYEERKAAFQPERFLPSVAAERRAELRIIGTALVEAYLKIQSMRMDAAGDHGRDKPDETAYLADVGGKRRESVKTERQELQEENERLANEYHAKARERFAEGDFHTVIEYCTLSIKHSDTNAECYALMAEALAKNPAHRWQLRAEEAFKRALELDTWNANLYLRMARFYRNQGMTQRACRLEEKALGITPSLSLDSPPERT